MYKYDLGHRFHTVVIIVVVSLRSSCTEREREREKEVVASIVTTACGEERGVQEVVALVLPLL